MRHVSEEIRGKYSEIPWEDIAGMRDKLIHDYFGVDIDKVWLTASEDIPTFKVNMIKLIKDLQSR